MIRVFYSRKHLAVVEINNRIKKNENYPIVFNRRTKFYFDIFKQNFSIEDEDRVELCYGSGISYPPLSRV